MFGKRKSSTDNFVMAMGKKAGNLKSIKAAPSGAGKQTVRKAPPAPIRPVMSPKGPGKKLPSPDAMKRGVKVNENKPQPMGKVGTFKINGILAK